MSRRRVLRHRVRRSARNRRGQSSIEFALVLPLLLAVVGLVVQVGLVVAGQLAAMHTAREVARVVSVDPGADPTAVGEHVSPFGWETTVTTRIEALPGTNRRLVIVTVSDQVPSVLGVDVPGRRIEARVAMALEYD